MPADVIAAIAAAVLTLIGITGIVVPVLPGSITVAAALLVWALWGGSSWGWVAFGVGIVLLAIGMVAGFVLTKRDLGKRQIPQWPVAVGLACGVIGMFVLPAFGLLIGFIVGLLASEYIRIRDFKGAVSTSLTAVKAIGLGMLIELACALTAGTLLAIGIVTHFVFG